jgi:hypothetical protein
MPATLSSLTNKTATVIVPLDENDPESETLKVTYRPKAYTKAVERKIGALAEGRSENAPFIAAQSAELIKAMVVKWDLTLTEDDPDPIPITDEGLEDVPTEVLSGIFMAIMADQKPDPKAKNS